MKSRPVCVLHVDDEPGFADLVGSFLSTHSGFEVVTETHPEKALERIETTHVDCVVSDYEMPGMSGLDLLERVRESHPTLPFILFTGKGTEEIASHAISAGVTDYLQKENGTEQFSVLKNRIENAVTQQRYERQYETLVDNLPGIVYRTELARDWPMAVIGGEVEKLTGYEADAIVNDDPSFGDGLVHPADEARIWESIQHQLDAGESFEVTYRILTADQEVRWVRDRGQVVDATAASETVIEGFITDITARKRQRAELDRQRTVFQTLVANLPAGVLVEDEHREILATNDRFCEMFDIADDPDALVGRDCARVATEVRSLFEDEDAFIEFVERTLEEREPVSAEYPLADGRLFECEYVPYELPGGEASLWVYRDVTDQRERERLLGGLFSDSLQAIGVKEIITDDEGTPVDYVYLDVNERFEEMTGLPADEVIGQRVTDVLPGIEETPFIEIFGEVAQTGESVKFEEYSEPLDRHFEVSAFAPQRGRCISIFSDITARKQRERDLERFKAFVENSSDIIVHLDEDGMMLYQSPGTERIFGHQPGIHTGENVFEFIHPDDRERVFETFVQGLTSPDPAVESVELRLEDAHGEYVWVEAAGVDQTDTDVGGVIVSLRDISERKRREQELEGYGETLEALQKMTRTLLDATALSEATEIAIAGIEDSLDFEIAGLWLYDESREVLEPTAVTERSASIIEQPPTYSRETDSISWSVFESGDSRLVDDLHDHEDRYNPQTAIRSEIVAPLGSHGVLNVGGTSPGMFTESDRTLVELWADTVTTVFNRIEREVELRTQESAVARERDRLEEFVGVLSHDLRNPLNVTMSRLELVADECESEHLAGAQRGLDRMERLLEDLLVLVREGETVGSTDAVRLDDLVTECWETVHTDEATLVCETARVVLADRSRLAQVFENLFRNAVEHTDGDVTITVGDLPDGIYIEDDGDGIPAADRERIFESGYSTARVGTGLGLAIVRRIVEAHGWTVTATEGTDGGARFELAGIDML